MSVRDIMNQKPWLGWAIAGVCVVIAAFSLIRGTSSNAPDSLERRSQLVTIRCTETGEEWEMNRGEFERLLLTTPGLIDPHAGIPSRFAEGRPTGVLVSKNEWTETVERINAMKKAYGAD